MPAHTELDVVSLVPLKKTCATSQTIGDDPSSLNTPNSDPAGVNAEAEDTSRANKRRKGIVTR